MCRCPPARSHGDPDSVLALPPLSEHFGAPRGGSWRPLARVGVEPGLGGGADNLVVSVLKGLEGYVAGNCPLDLQLNGDAQDSGGLDFRER